MPSRFTLGPPVQCGVFGYETRCSKYNEGKKWNRLQSLAEKCKPLDEDILSRMCKSVKVATGSMNSGLLTTLMTLLRWSDWQLPAFFRRGFKVAGLVEASHNFPLIAPSADESLDSLLNEAEADAWN